MTHPEFDHNVQEEQFWKERQAAHADDPFYDFPSLTGGEDDVDPEVNTDLHITVKAREINEAARRLCSFNLQDEYGQPTVPTLEAALNHWLALVVDHILDSPEAYTRTAFYSEWNHALECAIPDRP